MRSILFVAVAVGWLPAVGSVGITAHILPEITLDYPMAAEIMRIARSGMIDTLGEDYITVTYTRSVKRRFVN